MGKVTRVALMSASLFFLYARALMVGRQRRPTQTQHASCLKSIDVDTIPATSAAATSTSEMHVIYTPSTSPFQNEYTIRQALFAELSVIASLVTAGFHPELDSNPILRPIRVLIELDRLQNNFPFQGDD